MIYLLLFSNFFLIGLFSFGGGYAMLPLIERQITNNGWMSTEQFTEVIALSGMLPGSIGTNAAIFTGYHTAGLPGSIVAILGIILPSLLLVLLIGKFYQLFSRSERVLDAFYGLKPVIVSLILYSAYKFTLSSEVISKVSIEMIGFILIFILSLSYLVIRKGHPVYVIFVAGIIGIIFYY